MRGAASFPVWATTTCACRTSSEADAPASASRTRAATRCGLAAPDRHGRSSAKNHRRPSSTRFISTRGDVLTRSSRSARSMVAIWEALATASRGKPVDRFGKSVLPGARERRVAREDAHHHGREPTSVDLIPLNHQRRVPVPWRRPPRLREIGPPDLAALNHHTSRRRVLPTTALVRRRNVMAAVSFPTARPWQAHGPTPPSPRSAATAAPNTRERPLR